MRTTSPPVQQILFLFFCSNLFPQWTFLRAIPLKEITNIPSKDVAPWALLISIQSYAFNIKADEATI